MTYPQFYMLCLIFSLAFSGYTRAAELASAPVEAIETHRMYQLDGTVEAVHQSTLTAQTSGQVVDIFFDVEDFVEKGTLIIQLRDTEQKANLAKAQAQLEAATAQKEEAAKEYQRIKGIYAKKLVAKSELDQALAALDTTTAHQAAALAALSQAQEQQEYTRIKAPFSGIVTQRHIEIGELAQPGTPLMSGISLERLRVSVDVPQSMISLVRQYNKGFVRPNGADWIEAGGMTIFPFAEKGSNTFKVRLQLPEQTENLFPGMLIKAAFMIGKWPRLVIPRQAVVYRSEVTGCYVVSADGKIGFRHIRLGQPVNDTKVAILSGLTPEERVALDPIKAGAILKAQRTQAAD